LNRSTQVVVHGFLSCFLTPRAPVGLASRQQFAALATTISESWKCGPLPRYSLSGRLRGRSRKLRCSTLIPAMRQTTGIGVCRYRKTTMTFSTYIIGW